MLRVKISTSLSGGHSWAPTMGQVWGNSKCSGAGGSGRGEWESECSRLNVIHPCLLARTGTGKQQAPPWQTLGCLYPALLPSLQPRLLHVKSLGTYLLCRADSPARQENKMTQSSCLVWFFLNSPRALKCPGHPWVQVFSWKWAVSWPFLTSSLHPYRFLTFKFPPALLARSWPEISGCLALRSMSHARGPTYHSLMINLRSFRLTGCCGNWMKRSHVPRVYP